MPISTSPKGRLALAAVSEFGARPFGDVAVANLARAAGVTTGALYHHFGSKLGLYQFVRDDVERRLVDRLEGAFAAGGGVADALAVAFDFAVAEQFLHLVDVPPAATAADTIAEVIGGHVRSPLLGAVLVAAWRAAIHAVGEGASASDARAALQAIDVRPRPVIESP